MKKITTIILSFLVVAAVAYGADLSKYAKVISMKGKVMLESGEAVRMSVSVGDFILIKDKIVTGPTAEITVKIKGFGVFTVKENSTVVINDMVNRGGQLSMKMPKGRMLFGIKKIFNKAREAVSVETPSAVAAVRGTAFVISSSEASTDVAVLTGEVAMQNEHGEVSVPELQEASVTPSAEAKVTRIKKATFASVKEILDVKDIATIKDVGDLEGNLKRLTLILEGKADEDVVTESADVSVESTEMETTETRGVEKMESTEESIDAETPDATKPEENAEEDLLIQDSGDL